MILSASHAGFPLSTTHVISGAIMGAGAAKRVSAVRWGVAGNIVGRLGAHAAGLRRRRRASPTRVVALLGSETLGPIVVSAVLVAALSVALGRRLLAGRTLTAEG